MSNIEVLMSTMNIKSRKQFYEKIKEANINTKVTVINQINNNEEILNFEEGDSRIYSYVEKGVSKSRNRLLEKANGEICIFADDDVVYNDEYEETILDAYSQNKKAEGILFYVENINTNREKNKRIRNKKLKSLDIMRARIYGLSLRKEAIEKIKRKNIKFNENFGPGGIIHKGEEAIFIKELIDNRFNLYSVNRQIGYVNHKNSNWFQGFDSEFMYNQGAVFYELFPNYYKLLILQYIIRKYSLYKNNLSMFQAYTQMTKGANYLRNK